MKISAHPHISSHCIRLLLVSWLTLLAQSSAAQALKPGPAAETAAATTQAARNYTPKAGESIDSVIANTLADSPLKIELLRQAYVEQNPNSFLPGKAPMLRKGVVLTVPDHAQLLHKILPPKPASGVDQNSYLSPSSEERRRWVHFP